MIPVTLIEETYPAPPDAYSDYDPEPDSEIRELAVGFRELVSMIKSEGLYNPNGDPDLIMDPEDWLYSEGEHCYRSGAWRRTSLHLHRDHKPCHFKAWVKAWRAAGVIR